MRKESKASKMTTRKGGLYDIINGIRAAKDLISEIKEVYPDLHDFLVKSGNNRIDSNMIKSAMNFVTNKIMNDPFVVLGVSKDDPVDLVEAVYKVKAKFYHPDNKDTGNINKFIRIHEAYEKVMRVKNE